MYLWTWLNICLTTNKSPFLGCCSKSPLEEEVLLVGEQREEDEDEEECSNCISPFFIIITILFGKL